MSIVFPIRKITWSDYDTVSPVLLQEQNGPCPLIALVNTLIFKSDIKTRESVFNGIQLGQFDTEIVEFKQYLLNKHSIELQDLLSRLGDLLVKVNLVKIGYDLDKLLESLPLLHTGLDVNPNLCDGSFEQDLAVDLFQIFDVKLVHGWVIEPENGAFQTVEELKYFDSIQDHLISETDPVLQEYLNTTSTQFTEYGKKLLDEKVITDEFVVLFRNNHFSTLYKKGDDDFYTLLTDSSFGSRTKIVWQSLISTLGGDDLFFSGDFLPVLEDTNDYVDMEIDDENRQIIKQLQEQDDEEYAKRLEKKFNKRGPTVKEPINPAKPAKPAKPADPAKPRPAKDTEKEKKKKLTCIIV